MLSAKLEKINDIFELKVSKKGEKHAINFSFSLQGPVHCSSLRGEEARVMGKII